MNFVLLAILVGVDADRNVPVSLAPGAEVADERRVLSSSLIQDVSPQRRRSRVDASAGARRAETGTDAGTDAEADGDRLPKFITEAEAREVIGPPVWAPMGDRLRRVAARARGAEALSAAWGGKADVTAARSRSSSSGSNSSGIGSSSSSSSSDGGKAREGDAPLEGASPRAAAGMASAAAVGSNPKFSNPWLENEKALFRKQPLTRFLSHVRLDEIKGWVEAAKPECAHFTFSMASAEQGRCVGAS